MNIVVGNSAGVFSGLTCQLAWMLVAENPENDVNLQLHAINKTSAGGNHFLDYEPCPPGGRSYLHSSECDNHEEIVGSNLLLKFFKESDLINTNILESTYLESNPIDVNKKFVKVYPDDLHRGGKGNSKEQFNNLETLKEVTVALNRQWNKLEFNDEFAKLVDQEEQLIAGKKVLSIMLRTTPHYIDPKTNRPLTDTNYVIDCAIESVKKRIDDYDAVLLVTQIQPFVDRFVEEFGDKCIFTDRERLATDSDWVGGRGDGNVSMTDEEYETEYRNVLLDVLLASKTKHVLGSASNMFMGTLIMNPEITFEPIDNLSDFEGC